VSGTPEQSEAGTLLVMVGADDEAVVRCRPVFETFGDPVVHVGPVGTGQLAKLVNNVVLTANLGLVATALDVGGSLGSPGRPPRGDHPRFCKKRRGGHLHQ